MTAALANAEFGGIPQLGDFNATTGEVLNMRNIVTLYATTTMQPSPK